VIWTIRTIGLPRYGREAMDDFTHNPVIIILLTIVAGMIGSHFHLSRPLFSFLAILNLRTSWLSREILFTVLFVLCVGILWSSQTFLRLPPVFKDWSGWLGVLFGICTIFCMSRAYQLPTQVVWNTPITTYSFFANTLLLGILATAVILVFDLQLAGIQASEKLMPRAEIVHQTLRWLAGLAIPFVFVVFILDYLLLKMLQRQGEVAHLSLALILNLYQPLGIFRIIVMLAGVAWLAWTVFLNHGSIHRRIGPVYMACLLVFVGEILGRFLFYATHIRIGL